MEEQQNNPVRVDKVKSNRRTLFYTVAGVFVAGSLFLSGWLFGSGRLTISTDRAVPSIVSNSSVPKDGLDELYTQVLNNFDGEITDEDILNGMKSGLVSALNDPFSEYLTAEETTAFNDSLNGTFEGIGAELSKEGNFVQVVAPIKGTPADRAGIQPQDIITEIDGEPATDITVSEAVERIRGPKGEKVVLTIIREGEQLEVPIIRDTIEIASVEWEKQGQIGVITISRFGDDTVSLTNQAAQELKDQGVSSIILDLRGNPGGLLDASVDVSGIWLQKGSTVLEEKRGGEVVETFKTTSQPILAGIPTVVLINEGSASASEIVAGALRDNDVATIIGTTSFGKGSVQRLIPLNGGGSLKVTIARWYTPDGISIDKEGIKPDTEVELTAEDREAGSDPQLDEAKKQLQ